MPPQFETPEPAHLICAIEVSSPGKQVLERIDRIEQLIRHVANDADERLLVSVISYGPHSFDRSAPEVPTSILSWRPRARWPWPSWTGCASAVRQRSATLARLSSSAC